MAVDRNMNGETVAVKVYKKKNMNIFALNSAYFEHSMMKDLDHPNILKSTSYFEDANYIAIVQELMSADLRTILVHHQL